MKTKRIFHLALVATMLLLSSSRNIAEEIGCSECLVPGGSYNSDFQGYNDGVCYAGTKKCGTIRLCKAGYEPCSEWVCRTWRQPVFCIKQNEEPIE